MNLAERITALGGACLVLALLGWRAGVEGLLLGLALFALGSLFADPPHTVDTTTDGGAT